MKRDKLKDISTNTNQIAALYRWKDLNEPPEELFTTNEREPELHAYRGKVALTRQVQFLVFVLF